MPPFHELDSDWTNVLFDEAPTPMALVAADGGFTRCNGAFCALLGYARSELLARTWQSITHPDDVAGDASGAEQLRIDPAHDVYTVAKRYISKTGAIVWVNLHVRAVWHANRFVCFYAVAFPVAHHGVLDPVKPQPKSLVEWARANPREAAFVAGAASLFLGRDALASIIQILLKG